MAVLKIKSVPQKYTDELAYQQLLDYIMRSDKTPDHYIGGFAVHPQYAAEEMPLVSQAYHQNRGRADADRIACLPAGSWHSPAALDHQL